MFSSLLLLINQDDSYTIIKAISKLIHCNEHAQERSDSHIWFTSFVDK